MRFDKALAILGSLAGIFSGCASTPGAPDPGCASTLGVCASPRDERALCHGSPLGRDGVCVAEPCGAGQTTLDSGGCVPTLGLNVAAHPAGLTVDEGEHFECPAHTRMVALASASGPRGLCLARNACPFGSRWLKGQCAAMPRCAGQAIFDETTGTCTQLVARSGGALDVGAWARAALGADGGRAASYWCGPLAQRPLDLGAVSDSPSTVVATIDLVFVGNDPRSAEVTVRTRDLSQAPAVEGVVRPLVDLLRRLPGPTSASRVTVQTRCAVPGPGTAARVSAPRG